MKKKIDLSEYISHVVNQGCFVVSYFDEQNGFSVGVEYDYETIQDLLEQLETGCINRSYIQDLISNSYCDFPNLSGNSGELLVKLLENNFQDLYIDISEGFNGEPPMVYLKNRFGEVTKEFEIKIFDNNYECQKIRKP